MKFSHCRSKEFFLGKFFPNLVHVLSHRHTNSTKCIYTYCIYIHFWICVLSEISVSKISNVLRCIKRVGYDVTHQPCRQFGPEATRGTISIHEGVILVKCSQSLEKRLKCERLYPNAKCMGQAEA